MRYNADVIVEGNLEAPPYDSISFAEFTTNTTSNSGEIAILAGQSFPTSPDGSKKYVVSAQIRYVKSGGNAGAVVGRIRMGSNGTIADTEVSRVDGDHANSAGRQGMIRFSGLVVQPSSGESLTLSIDASTNSVTYGNVGGVYLTIRELRFDAQGSI